MLKHFTEKKLRRLGICHGGQAQKQKNCEQFH